MKRWLCGLLLGVALCAALEGRNLFVMPSGATSTANVYSADTSQFSLAGTLLVSPAAFTALATPSGAKYYVVARSAADTIVIANSSLARVHSLALPQAAEAAALTPDGGRLLVGGGSILRIFNTATDTELAAVDVGGQITDLAVALDGSRVFVLSSLSQRLIAVDLGTNSSVGSLFFSAYPATAVTVGPNGLVYVSGQSRILEIDGRTMTLRTGGEIVASGTPGRLSFTPDGTYAMAVNLAATAGGVLAFRVDLRTRAVAHLVGTGVFSGVTLTQLVVASSSRAFAVSQGQKLYEVTLDSLAMDETLLRGTANTGVTTLALSNEVPARHLFVVAQGGVQRFEVAFNVSTGTQGPLPYTPGSLAYAGQAATGPVASLAQFNGTQTVAVGGTSLPLIVRATDGYNRPIYGAAVSFSTSVSGVTITNVTPLTGLGGFAQATAVMTWASPGVVPIVASVGGAYSTFFLNVGGTTPGVGAGIQIVSGNGQVVHEWLPTTWRPLVVAVKDSSGTPVPNATVSWQVTAGSAMLSSYATQTDSSGQAYVTATANPIFAADYFQCTIAAIGPDGSSVVFYLTVLAKIQTGQGIRQQVPSIQILPLEGPITGRAGQTLSGAIQVTIRTETTLRPIPYVGVEVTGNQDPALGPVVACTERNLLTDANGFAKCDLMLGRSPGQGTISVNVGSLGGTVPGAQRSYDVEVVAGDPASVQAVQGDGQSGSPGQTLPAPLVAEVRDSSGNVLAGVAVLWEFGAGGTGARLSNVSTVTDGWGRVSATVTLGPSPGTLVVRVRAASNPNLMATFTLRAILPVAGLVKISGDGQTAVINEAFASPLVVEARDTQGRAVPNVVVSFTVTGGSATLASSTATAGSDGRASMTVRAGSTAGAITISATADGQTVVFNLTARLPGPTLTAASFLNGASFRPGVVPGAVTAIVGAGLAPGIRGCVGPGTVVGPLPTKVADVEVAFGGIAAPIFAVCNVAGQEQAIVQAPWEMAAGYTVMVKVSVAGGSTVVDGVRVLAALPGIFEAAVADGRRFAVAVGPDGALITPAKRAKKGDIVRFYATGLGPVLPLGVTNQPGAPRQKVWYSVIAGIGGKGVRVDSADLAVNMIGVYEIAIEIPSDAPMGDDVALDLAIITSEGASPIFAVTSKIALQ